MTRDETEQQVIQDFMETFATDHGLRTLDRLSQFCKEDDNCYTKGDSTDSAFNLGKRSVILMVRKQLNRKLKENKQKEAKNDRGS